MSETPPRMLSRRLPGATVLQIVPTMADRPAARAAVNIASALLRSGARAMVAGGPGMLVGQLQALGGEWVRFATDTLNPIKLKRNVRTLRDLIAGERIDVVHAYSGPAAWSAQSAAGETGAWLVTTYTGTPTTGVGFVAMYQAALARGHRVIADSYYAADLIVSRHGAQPEQIAALARSIDTGRFEPSAVSAERVAVLRHAWGIRPGWRVVLVPGALRPANGQMNVVDAVRILVNGGLRGVAFVIAGDGAVDEDYARAIGERVEAQGIGGLVRLAGYCPDMPAAYVIADSVIVPSLGPSTFEPVAVEAHAMGRPVIASSIGSLPEIVLAPPHVDEEDRTGWLVTPNDPVDLARALAAVLALGPALHAAIGERARSLAEMRFSPARVAEATLDLYTSLLEGEG